METRKYYSSSVVNNNFTGVLRLCVISWTRNGLQLGQLDKMAKMSCGKSLKTDYGLLSLRRLT